MIFFQNTKGVLFKGDALTTLRNQIKSNSVDVIITSPPYNLGNKHHNNKKKIQCYDDNLPESIYQREQHDVLNECFRVLKSDGSMFYNHKNRIKDHVSITPYQWLLKTDFIIKQELVWINKSPNFDKIRFYPWTERIYWLSKTKQTKFINSINGKDYFDWNDWTPDRTKEGHTRTFPIQVPYDLLSCFPGSKVILDPYFGSGTTGLASNLLRKKWVGIEKAKEYCKEAKTRLALKIKTDDLNNEVEKIFAKTDNLHLGKTTLQSLNNFILQLDFNQRVESLKSLSLASYNFIDDSAFEFECDNDIFFEYLKNGANQREFQEACIAGDLDIIKRSIDEFGDMLLDIIEVVSTDCDPEIMVFLTEEYIRKINKADKSNDILKVKEFLNSDQLDKHKIQITKAIYNI